MNAHRIEFTRAARILWILVAVLFMLRVGFHIGFLWGTSYIDEANNEAARWHRLYTGCLNSRSVSR